MKQEKLSTASRAPSTAQFDVTICGAGICGLATALILARNGIRVCVVEKRLDPRSETGAATIMQAEQLIGSANEGLEDLPRARAMLDEATHLRSRIWGTRLRNVLLDTWSVAFLDELGVDVSTLPQIGEMTITWGRDQPSVSTRFSGPASYAKNGPMDIGEMVYRRDWARQPSIAQLEYLLLDIAEATAGVELHFGAAAVSYDRTSEEITVTLDNSVVASVRSTLLILADGGTRGSLSGRLPAKRRSDMQQVVELTAFLTGDVPRLSQTAAAPAYGYGEITANGWRAIADNGELATVQVSETDGIPELESYRHGLVHGISGRVIELGRRYTIGIDAIESCVIHDNVIVAGDAAGRGSPLLGLGAQCALLNAEAVGNHAVKALRQRRKGSFSAREHASRFADDTDAATVVRLGFEHATLNIVRQATMPGETMAGSLDGSILLDTLKHLQAEYRKDPSGHANFRLRLKAGLDAVEFRDVAGGPILLRGLRRLELKIESELKSSGTLIKYEIGGDSTIEMWTDVEQISIVSGNVFQSSDTNGNWCFELEDAVVERRSRAAFPTFSSRQRLDSFRFYIPATTIREIASRAADNLGKPGYELDCPDWLQANFEGGTVIGLGTLAFQVIGDTEFRASARPRKSGGQVLSFEFLKGHAKPLGFADFFAGLSTDSDNGRGLSRALTSSGLDIYINTMSRFGARFVRRVDMITDPGGAAELHFTGPADYRISLGAAEMTHLKTGILNLLSDTSALRSGQWGLKSFRVQLSS